MKHIVVSYDISDDRKRDKLANLLENYGKRVQYSVFECHLDEKPYDELLSKLNPIAKDDDSIRIYHLCEACLGKVVLLGRAKAQEEPQFYIV
jgi:CRISPR-associated protein Cas2